MLQLAPMRMPVMVAAAVITAVAADMFTCQCPVDLPRRLLRHRHRVLQRAQRHQRQQRRTAAGLLLLVRPDPRVMHPRHRPRRMPLRHRRTRRACRMVMVLHEVDLGTRARLMAAVILEICSNFRLCFCLFVCLEISELISYGETGSCIFHIAQFHIGCEFGKVSPISPPFVQQQQQKAIRYLSANDPSATRECNNQLKEKRNKERKKNPTSDHKNFSQRSPTAHSTHLHRHYHHKTREVSAVYLRSVRRLSRMWLCARCPAAHNPISSHFLSLSLTLPLYFFQVIANLRTGQCGHQRQLAGHNGRADDARKLACILARDLFVRAAHAKHVETGRLASGSVMHERQTERDRVA
jgi:hypothetical protein